LILAMIGIAQLLVVLDVTIVSIAHPSAWRELELSDDDRQWLVTAYALAFGSLLLVGGRKWAFIGCGGAGRPSQHLSAGPRLDRNRAAEHGGGVVRPEMAYGGALEAAPARR
jgi:MFS family permease